MATIGSAKATLVTKINDLTSTATAKDTIFLAKALKENTTHHSFTYQGAWAATTAYALDDVVTNGGNTYINKLAYTSGASFATGSNWDMMAAGGTTVGTGTAGQVLKTNAAGNAIEWGADEGGKVLQVAQVNWNGHQSLQTGNSYAFSGLAITLTPTMANSSFFIDATVFTNPFNHDCSAVFDIHDSALGSDADNASQRIFSSLIAQAIGSFGNNGYMSNMHSYGSDGQPDDYRGNQSRVCGMYTPASASASARTFTLVARSHRETAANGIRFNDQGSNQNSHSHQMSATSHIMVWEIANT